MSEQACNSTHTYTKRVNNMNRPAWRTRLRSPSRKRRYWWSYSIQSSSSSSSVNNSSLIVRCSERDSVSITLHWLTSQSGKRAVSGMTSFRAWSRGRRGGTSAWSWTRLTGWVEQSGVAETVGRSAGDVPEDISELQLWPSKTIASWRRIVITDVIVRRR